MLWNLVENTWIASSEWFSHGAEHIKFLLLPENGISVI